MTKKDKRLISFWDHIEELRWRVLKALLSIIILSSFFWIYKEPILIFLKGPALGVEGYVLQSFSPSGTFTAHLKVAFFGGFFLSIPIFIYQLWKFVSPAIDRKYDLFFFICSFFSLLLIIFAIILSYYIIVPFCLQFFNSFNSTALSIKQNIEIHRYISFIGWITFQCIITFQLPIIIIVFVKLGVITTEFLCQYRRASIVLFFIVSALLTPQDPITQIVFALPLVLLYEISIFFGKIIESK